MSKKLIVDPDKCTSCRLCEMACSERAVGAFRPTRSHIQIHIDVDAAVYFPRVCIQCEDAACVEACQTEALIRDPDTNAVIVEADNCTGCGMCVDACAYDAIHLFDDVAVKCDLCGGDPRCVPFCRDDALRLADDTDWPQAEYGAYANKLEQLAQEVKA